MEKELKYIVMEESQWLDWNGKVKWGGGWKRVVRKGNRERQLTLRTI